MNHIHASFDEETTEHPFHTLNEDLKESTHSLRPSAFEDYIGQERVAENLKVYIQSAKKRGRILDHCLFYSHLQLCSHAAAP